MFKVNNKNTRTTSKKKKKKKKKKVYKSLFSVEGFQDPCQLTSRNTILI